MTEQDEQAKTADAKTVDAKRSYTAETVTPLLTATTYEIVRRTVFLYATLALVEVAVEETWPDWPDVPDVDPSKSEYVGRTVYQVLSGSQGGYVINQHRVGSGGWVLPARHDTAKILEVASAARLAWRGSERGWDDPNVR